MRNRWIVLALSAVAFTAIVLAPGCQDATQATLEIRLVDAKKDLCPKLGGTAITVGAERDKTESVISSFVTAETRACDASTGLIGSLVVTPGPGGHAAIVVAVAFDTARAPNATACKPPAYGGCIVARRFFAFTSHKDLRLPITIDPDCLDVPCNATSTCRKGHCYDSMSDTGGEPGDDGHGGATEAGIVDGAIDGFVPDGAGPDGAPTDGAVDAPGGDGGVPRCNNGTLVCQTSGGADCTAGGMPCCAVTSPPSVYCGASFCGMNDTQICCSDVDCGGAHCNRGVGSAPGFCSKDGGTDGGGNPPTYCDGTTLMCPQNLGDPPTPCAMACCNEGGGFHCKPGPCMGSAVRTCCTVAQCTPQYTKCMPFPEGVGRCL